MNRLIAAAVFGLVFASAAQAQNLRFTGLALGACALTVPLDGTIALQPDLRSWATLTPASIVAINTAISTLTVTRDASWVLSPSGTPATTFTHTATTSGTNLLTLSGSGTSISATLALIGTTTLTVSIAGSAATPYPAGAYTAQVTVTCAPL